MIRDYIAVGFAVTVALTASSSRGQDAVPDDALLRGPYIQNLMAESVEVIWVSSGPDGPGQVRFERNDGQSLVVVESSELTCEALRPDVPGATCHRVRSTSLSPGTEYAYEVFVAEHSLTPGRPLFFRTPPPPGEGVVHFVALGDSGSATGAQLLVADVMLELDPDGILHTGDVDYLADPDRSIFEPYTDLLTRASLFPARGNHDNDYEFEKYFFVPGEEPGSERTYYSFDWGSVHVVFLDTNLPLISDEATDDQTEFLRQDLAEARARGLSWLIAVTHEPLFTIGPHATDADTIPTRNWLAPIFDEFEVDLVLSGHDHLYNRTYPIRTRDEICPELDNPCDEVDSRPRCYDVLDAEQEPHYAYPGGTIHVVTGGGGGLLYGELPDTLPCPDDPDVTVSIDKRFSSVLVADWHAVELRISPAVLEVKAWSLRGQLIDSFSLSKLRLLRGDVDSSGDLNIADAISALGALFLGQPSTCIASGDVNGDRGVDVADPISLLNFLFLGGPPPLPPFPECAPWPDASGHFCEKNGC